MNTLNGTPVKLRGPNPMLTLMVGNTAAGAYRFILFDPSNKNPQVFGQGLSHDQLPDSWPVPLTAPPQAVQVQFTVMPTVPVDEVPVTLILSEKNAPPYWTHTYVLTKAEFNKGLGDFFYLTA